MQAVTAFGQFNASLDKFAKQLGPYQNEVVRNIGFELFENIVVGGEFGPGTPVDTGFARNSWWVSVGEPGVARQAASPETRGTVPITALQDAGADITRVTVGVDLYLLSNTEYMLDLEFGHSGQAPEGMVRIVLAQAQDLVNKVARQMGAT